MTELYFLLTVSLGLSAVVCLARRLYKIERECCRAADALERLVALQNSQTLSMSDIASDQ